LQPLADATSRIEAAVGDVHKISQRVAALKVEV
jgi:hypothetical protein